jgi:hypothetical protein
LACARPALIRQSVPQPIAYSELVSRFTKPPVLYWGGWELSGVLGETPRDSRGAPCCRSARWRR